uniref:CCHC-type domain-containing protein n=1 Tax=Lactuca sativa TaxID=4236 RepID=A0A9R1WLN1_LACSA|nr:hypothetical protein LSAT_V11C100001310 [Lactuca sativa]
MAGGSKEEGSKEVVAQGTAVPFQCPKLTETNYTTWYIMIETVLRAYGHWDAITKDAVDEKKNYTTKGIIFQMLPENVLLQVAKHKNAKDVWESVKVRYIGAEWVQKARLQTLRNELEMLKMKDNESINDFSGKISGIVAKFKSLGSTLEEEVIVRKFLNSVPKKYLPIVSPIEQYSDLETMTFEEAVGRVKAYEERLQSHEEKEEEQGQVMMASEQKHGDSSGHGRGCGKNFERGGRGRGRGKGRGNKSGIRCYDCGDFGHFSYECTKWNEKDKEANLIEDEESALL